MREYIRGNALHCAFGNCVLQHFDPASFHLILVIAKLPVRIYGVVLSFMVMLAMHTVLGKNKKAVLWMMMGAILFVTSDLPLLAFNKFFSSFDHAGLTNYADL